MTPKVLRLKNLNNCLSCDSFIYITPAPDRAISAIDLEQVFLIKSEIPSFYAKIVDTLRVPFKWMPNIAAFAATGLELKEWRPWFLKQYPDTQTESKLMVYSFRKIEYLQ